MELKPDTAYPALHRTFLNTIQGYGMEQMVEANTRLDNTLDLMITNFPDSVPRVETIPGLSDHDVVYMELQVNQHRRRQAPRSIPLYNKTDWDSLKASARILTSQLTSTFATDHDTEEIWTVFKQGLCKAIKEHIPCKRSSPKPGLPWINTELKKLIRRRNRLYKKMKKTGDRDLKDEVRKLKRDIQLKTRRAYWTHVQTLFVDPVDEQHRPPNKKF